MTYDIGSPTYKERYNADIRATNILLQGLPKDIYTLINHYTDAKDIWDNVKMLLEGSELTKEDRESQLYDDFEHFCQNKGETIHDYYVRTSLNTKNQATVQDDKVVVQNVQGRQNRGQGNNARGTCAAGNGEAQNRVGNVNPGQARQIKCYNCNGIGHIARNCTQPKRPQNSEYFKDKMLLMQAQENGADECDAFDSDVDEAPTAQTMFMKNLSSLDPVYDEFGPSYDSDILSEERVQLLMQGTSLTKHERECKLYDALDKFTFIKRETFHKYYLRFTQLINDMNIYNMRIEQFQVNTKFLNSLPSEWSKFVTDVKLVKDLHTTNFDQLHAYFEQHELYANEVRLLRERNQDPLAFVANQQITSSHFNTYQSSYNNPQLQQQFSPSKYKSNATSSRGNNVSGHARLVKFYNCQGEGHKARQCTQHKRSRNVAWYKEKAMLAEAQEVGQILNEEQLAFLVDPGVIDGQSVLTIILKNADFQTEDLDTYDSDCDDISNSQAVLMANISNCVSDVILEAVQIILWYLDSGCSKHMTGNRSQLMNFVSKFLVPVAAAPRAADLANSPVLTSIDQDAPSSSTPSTKEKEQSSNISQGFEESLKTPIFRDDLLNEPLHE
nr:hypothetical protein [Tanacetum cinerariifolium]